ncbi:MAG: BtrH N-terminal domain-containing protein, partial [Erysipelothrix sp.]
SMDFPFLGGRTKTDLLTQNIARNLNLNLNVFETSSKNKAWNSVKKLIDMGKTVGIKLDCYHLEYFTNPVHFAGHYVALTGYDEDNVYLVDTLQQSSQVSTSLDSFSSARNEKGPMSSRNLYYTIEKNEVMTPLKDAITSAIHNNVQAYLNPPISNLTYKGIEKASRQIIKWFDESNNVQEEFAASAMMMERAGTGGALFRNLYRDFLKEAYDLTHIKEIQEAYMEFVEIASLWNEIIRLFDAISETQDREAVLTASKIMLKLSLMEKNAMTLMANI